MIPFLPVVVIGSRSLAYQGAADAASQACEGLPLRTLAFLPLLRWNDLIESPFQLYNVIPACGDIDSCAHVPCQSKTPISHWTAGCFCDGCLGGGAGSIGVSEF